jgi:hypothetical protein
MTARRLLDLWTETLGVAPGGPKLLVARLVGELESFPFVIVEDFNKPWIAAWIGDSRLALGSAIRIERWNRW